jgi:Na+(H+)/acetate symporter ActP
MLLVVGAALGLLLAGSAFFVVRGFVGLFRRRSKAALAVLGGVALFAVTVVLLVLASYLLGPSSLAEGPEKAHALAKNISTLMNLSFFGIPLGLVLGLVAEIRARRPGKDAA